MSFRAVSLLDQLSKLWDEFVWYGEVDVREHCEIGEPESQKRCHQGGVWCRLCHLGSWCSFWGKQMFYYSQCTIIYIHLTVLYSWEMCHKKLVQFICTDFYCQNQPISLIVVINSVWKIYLVKTIDYCIYWIEDVMNSFRKICCSDLNIIHVNYIAICILNCNFIRI